ncbi:hypothetical protein TSAR_010607, partial [Trichomalopsis sarcophagae]
CENLRDTKTSRQIQKTREDFRFEVTEDVPLSEIIIMIKLIRSVPRARARASQLISPVHVSNARENKKRKLYRWQRIELRNLKRKRLQMEERRRGNRYSYERRRREG